MFSWLLSSADSHSWDGLPFCCVAWEIFGLEGAQKMWLTWLTNESNDFAFVGIILNTLLTMCAEISQRCHRKARPSLCLWLVCAQSETQRDLCWLSIEAGLLKDDAWSASSERCGFFKLANDNEKIPNPEKRRFLPESGLRIGAKPPSCEVAAWHPWDWAKRESELLRLTANWMFFGLFMKYLLMLPPLGSKGGGDGASVSV